MPQQRANHKALPAIFEYALPCTGFVYFGLRFEDSVRFLLFAVALLCELSGTQLAAAESCSAQPLVFQGQEFFERCHCIELPQAEAQQIGLKYGIRVEPISVSGQEINGKSYAQCGVSLRWESIPPDAVQCCADKAAAVADFHKLSVPFSYPALNCGAGEKTAADDFTVDACLEGKTWACISAEKAALAAGSSEEAGRWRALKCKDPRHEGPFWNDLVDCEGMADFLDSTCRAGAGLPAEWACEALKHRETPKAAAAKTPEGETQASANQPDMKPDKGYNYVYYNTEQKLALKYGHRKTAEQLRMLKCRDAMEASAHWNEMLDCDGMQDFLELKCQDGDQVERQRACSALKKYESPLVTRAEREAELAESRSKKYRGVHGGLAEF